MRTRNVAIVLFDGVEALDFCGPFERFVDNGHVILSAGITAGIDMSLYVIQRLLGNVPAVETAAYLEYHWRHQNNVHQPAPKRTESR